MFNLQGSELIIILLLALVVLGPEKLPDAMRKAGQFYAELKKMSTGFQSEFRAAVEEPLKELRETANTIRDSADFTKLQSGERAEKPKSAEMVAAPDPDDVPSSDLPFRPGADEAGSEPVAEQPSDVAPGDQEPFASVVLTNRSIDRPIGPDDASDGQPPVTKMAPVAFSGHQVSSAGPPVRAASGADSSTGGDDAGGSNTADQAADASDTVDHAAGDSNTVGEAASDDPVERAADADGTELSE